MASVWRARGTGAAPPRDCGISRWVGVVRVEYARSARSILSVSVPAAGEARRGGVVQVGVVLPQTEIGATAASLRTYAREVETLGYDHVLAYDHVVGADPAVHEGWSGPYDIDTQFHEPFVLFGFIAGCTSLACVSGIVILPQRQTALVAKQAAEVDLLTNGTFRLGIGIGWVLVIVVEMLAVKGGIGYAMWTAYQFMRIDLIIASMFTVGVLGFLTDRLLLLISRRLTRWNTGLRAR